MTFNFSVPIKKQKSSNKKLAVKLYTTITKNIYCVATIDIDGNYRAVDINTGNSFIITSRSYHLKTNQYYCQQLIDNKRLGIITLDKKEKFDRPWLYLPFAPGVGMVGNIVESNVNSVKMFDLNKTFIMPKTNPLSKEAFIYYKENYKEIYNKILTKYNVAESV